MEKYEVYRDSVDGLPSCQLEVQLYQKKIQDLAENREKLASVLKEVIMGIGAWDLLPLWHHVLKKQVPAVLCEAVHWGRALPGPFSPTLPRGRGWGATDITCCSGFQRKVEEVLNSCLQLLEVLLQVT